MGQNVVVGLIGQFDTIRSILLQTTTLTGVGEVAHRLNTCLK
jgi:hypothetical protein